jgi:hypothetical protein
MINNVKNSNEIIIDRELMLKHLEVLEQTPKEYKNNLYVKSFLSILIPRFERSYVDEKLIDRKKLNLIF